MRIIPPEKIGLHAVELIATSQTDARILKQIFDAFRVHPQSARARMQHDAGDEFPSLILEETV